MVHDSDVTRAEVLIDVLTCNRQGIYRRRYAFPDEQPLSWRRKVWRNRLDALHEPRRFRITVPTMDFTPRPPASEPRPTGSAPAERDPSAGL